MSRIHIFRKDLRVVDNEALVGDYNSLYTFFHIDDHQIFKKETAFFRSNNAIRFMIESLEDLDNTLNGKLNIFMGSADEFFLYLEKISKLTGISECEISINLDYTGYATKKDNMLKEMCKNKNIKLLTFENDHSLSNMSELLKPDSSPYVTYGHFYKKSLNSTIKKPINDSKKLLDQLLNKVKIVNRNKDKKDKKEEKIFNIREVKKIIYSKLGINSNFDTNIDILRGGRGIVVRKIKQLTGVNLKKTIERFENRDDLSSSGANGLNISPYLNFGCISSRELVYYFKYNEDIVKQMRWRDFYLCILRYNDKSKKYVWLDDRYNKLKWRDVRSNQFQTEWNDFINCETNILLVDAAMSELKQTGFMNNRARLLWATFVVKYMQSDPFHPIYGGISLFSRYLVDCSTSQNKMNFEWIISSLDIGGRRFCKKGESPLTGRVISIDNKLIKKYNAYNYIRKWLPKYKNVSDKEILKVEPSLDLKKRYQKYCDMFKTIK
jgi:deoxyribodipyrimidine photo-lyase